MYEWRCQVRLKVDSCNKSNQLFSEIKKNGFMKLKHFPRNRLQLTKKTEIGVKRLWTRFLEYKNHRKTNTRTLKRTIETNTSLDKEVKSWMEIKSSCTEHGLLTIQRICGRPMFPRWKKKKINNNF